MILVITVLLVDSSTVADATLLLVSMIAVVRCSRLLLCCMLVAWLAGCTDGKALRVKSERSYPGQYLQVQRMDQQKVDSGFMLRVQLRNRARYTAYKNPTLVLFFIGDRGDTIASGMKIFPDSIGPHRKRMVSDRLLAPEEAKTVKLSFVTGVVK